MTHVSFVSDFAVVLGVAAAIGLTFRWLRQPVILGYLVAGLFVGPYIPFPLFADLARTQALSEFGVVLVMFAVGLEFSLRRVAEVLPVAGITALVQIAGLFWGANLFARAIGLSPLDAFFLGASVAISSTMVVSKVFEEHPPPANIRGFVFGVLVLQDAAAIVLLTAVTALAAGSGMGMDELITTLGRLAGVLTIGTVGGLLIVPRLVRWAVRHGSPEVLVVLALGACFALAAGAEGLGYSPALGAFLAGMLVAESGHARRVEHLVAPVRDVFAGVFFVSIGMTVDPTLAVVHLPFSLALSAIVIVLQLVTVTSAGILSGAGLPRSVRSGLSLGQIGEFGFIIMGVGTQAGIVPDYLFSVIVTTAVITAFTTPVAVRYAPRIASALENRLPPRLRGNLALYEAWLDALRRGRETTDTRRRVRRLLRIVALEATVVGAIVIGVSYEFRVLHEALSRYLPAAVAAVSVVLLATAIAFPFARGLARAAKRLGVLFADSVFPASTDGRTDLAATSRQALGFAMQLTVLLAVSLPLAALTQPFLPPGVPIVALAVVLIPVSVVLWRSAQDLQGHVSSASEALVAALGRGISPGEEPALDDLLHGLGDPIPVTLEEGWPVVGRTLAEIDLRVATGATVLGISRRQGDVVAPSGHQRLQVGDTLALVGAADAIARARALLAGETEAPQPDPDEPSEPHERHEEPSV
jgi:monovalent cation:H+ antiporter-2, CPA2 family